MSHSDMVIATANKDKVVVMFTLFNNDEQLSRSMKEATIKRMICTTMSKEQAKWSLENNLPYSEYPSKSVNNN